LAAAANPEPLEIAALPPDYSKKWSPALPRKPKVPPRPATMEVCAKVPPQPAPAPTPPAAVPTNATPPGDPNATAPASGFSPNWHHRTALLIMTALFLALSAIQIIRSVDMALTYRQTEGKVIGFEEVQTRQRTGVSTATYPIVAYQVPGKTYKIQGSNSTGPVYGYYQVGQPVKVRYLPSEPANGGIDSFNERWQGAIICGILGFASLVGWLVLRFWNKISPLVRSIPSQA
jgi:hypothetical protein